MTPSLLLELCLVGIASGSIYALGAMGFVLIYKSSNVFNFALGDMMMIGAFFVFAFMVQFGLPWYVGIPLAMICSACWRPPSSASCCARCSDSRMTF